MSCEIPQALAVAHPQQLHWPFNLSAGHFGPEGLQRAAKLEPLLASPLLSAFGAALNDTTYPVGCRACQFGACNVACKDV